VHLLLVTCLCQSTAAAIPQLLPSLRFRLSSAADTSDTQQLLFLSSCVESLQMLPALSCFQPSAASSPQLLQGTTSPAVYIPILPITEAFLTCLQLLPSSSCYQPSAETALKSSDYASV
jgi:hypothetical protein